MNFLLQPAVILISGVMRLGPLRVSVYGLFAAVGLLAALLLSQRTARLAGLAVQPLWDAGMFAVTAALVLSRGLLIVRDVHAFRMFPLVVLALPSYTYGGMALTAVAVAGYLRWKRLPLLAVMDAWAPCAALLAALLSLGHFFEGTDAGMPTSLPWGPVVPGSAGLVHLQPVQLYGAVAAVGLFVMLMWMLRTLGAKAPLLGGVARPEAEASGYLCAGVVAGWGLVTGGAVAFGLEMLTQPVMVRKGAWLETGQWIAVVTMVAGTLLLLHRPGSLERGKQMGVDKRGGGLLWLGSGQALRLRWRNVRAKLRSG